MCLAKESESPQKEANSPRSPWAKLLNRQYSKPKLQRKVASSARINLNKCWSKLGELMSNSSPRTDLPKADADDEPLVLAFADFFYPIDAVKPAVTRDNKDHPRFELLDDNLEINDNTINEVREICYSSNLTTCTICKLSN